MRIPVKFILTYGPAIFGGIVRLVKSLKNKRHGMNENVVPMSDGEYGIKETQEAVIGAGEFVSKLDEALSDGKYDIINDSLLIAPTLPKLIEAIKGGKQIPMEIDDLDLDEYNKLLLLIEEKFELTRDYAERVAEAAFRWLIATTDLAFAVKGD